MRWLLLSIMVGLPIVAQVFLPARRTAPSSPSVAEWTPESIPTIRYYWHFEDLIVDAPVTNWYDRIQSNNATQGTESSRPSNTVDGVFFDGGDSLVPSTFTTSLDMGDENGVQSTIFVILTPITPASSFGGVLAGADSGTYGLLTTSANKFHEWATHGNQEFGSFASGGITDFLLTIQLTKTNVWYTNGVQSATNSSVGDWPPGNTTRIGRSGGASTFYKGHILEIIVFSNKLALADIALLHDYATNTYGYSP